MDCLFCKIIAGEIPSNKVYEDDKILAFHDISEENSQIVAHIFSKIPEIAKSLNLENGYRIVNNCGEDGGQTVFHLHFHLLGGKKLNTQLA